MCRAVYGTSNTESAQVETKNPPVKTKRKTTSFTLFLYGLIAGLLIGISALALYLFYDHLQSAGKVETSPIQMVRAQSILMA